MISRVVKHIQGNAIAYVALFFAVGGGGGYAVAATVSSSNVIHACVSKRTGAVFIVKACGKTTRALVFNQRGPTGLTGKTGPAGPGSAFATATVASTGAVFSETNMTVTQVSTGVYDVTLTGPCTSGGGSPTVTPFGSESSGSEGGIPTAWLDVGEATGTNFSVHAGDIQNGSFVSTNQGFDVTMQCAEN